MTANLAPGLELRAVLLLPACPDQPNLIADSASIYTYIYIFIYVHTHNEGQRLVRRARGE